MQRTGDQGEGKLLFVQNNFYYDAFFLKAIGELYMSPTGCAIKINADRDR